MFITPEYTSLTAIHKPIWYTKTETADRVRRRIEAVLSPAKNLKLRAGENPALWRGHLSYLFDSPKVAKDARVPEENRHHPHYLTISFLHLWLNSAEWMVWALEH